MKNELNQRIEKINAALEKYLPEKNNPQSEIYRAMRYSVFAGGKRLRPILMTESCKMCGGDINAVMPFACAMEMIHTYSLIHDDLPAMDNDDLRRGIPTNHIKFGEATAILAGDALLNRAFEVASEYGKNAPNAMDALICLAKSSGTEGMIGGQVVDIASEGQDIDLDRLRYIHLLKTGAIIRSSCVIGAIVANADKAEIDAVDKFASNLGVAFQIRDDILDVTGDENTLGKPVGSDEKSEKNTYVKLLGVEKSEELVKEYSKKAADALSLFGDKADFLIRLADYLVNRTV